LFPAFAEVNHGCTPTGRLCTGGEKKTINVGASYALATWAAPIPLVLWQLGLHQPPSSKPKEPKSHGTLAKINTPAAHSRNFARSRLCGALASSKWTVQGKLRGIPASLLLILVDPCTNARWVFGGTVSDALVSHWRQEAGLQVISQVEAFALAPCWHSSTTRPAALASSRDTHRLFACCV